ncbi:MAG: MotA/TolQ/ExbB proton channel family protein [Deltaproteobacteria bacterium]|nr:MotA/TolQ/ExbB proton channel family protein [Deltaproteobacteria bacterium]
MFGHDLVQKLQHGGYSLVVIGVLSLLALLVAAERVLAWWGVVAQARRLSEQVSKSVLRGDLAQGRSACERSRALVGDLFLAGFARHGQGAKDFEQVVERSRQELLLKLKSNLWLLGTIGSIAPFVGLFGTVVGIQNAFQDMAAAGTGGFVVVATGIGAALDATAAGIFVAVEAVVLYNYFQARLGRVSAEVKLIAEEFVELLKERPAPAVTSPADPVAEASTVPGAASPAAQG